MTPKDRAVGAVGWRVAMSLLGFERGEAAATGPIRLQAELDRLFILDTARWAQRCRRSCRSTAPLLNPVLATRSNW